MAAEPLFYSLTAFAFALGAVIGSFLNVVAHRVPAGVSVVRPGSRCPHCETPIRWYDNIPIVSWIVLEAKCRHCDAPIATRYVFVEALMGFLSVALWIKVASPHFQVIGETTIPQFPPPVPHIAALPWGSIGLIFGLYLAFLALLVVISLVDFDHYLIPHEFTLPGIAVGVIAALLLNSETVIAPGALAAFWPPVSLSSSLLGLIGGGLAVVLLFYVYFALRGIAGLGGGDVTMMALVGAWLGWPALIFVFFAASIQGLIAAAFGALFGANFLKNSEEIMAADDPRPPKPGDEDSQQAVNGAVDTCRDCDDEHQALADRDSDSEEIADVELPAPSLAEQSSPAAATQSDDPCDEPDQSDRNLDENASVEKEPQQDRETTEESLGDDAAIDDTGGDDDAESSEQGDQDQNADTADDEQPASKRSIPDDADEMAPNPHREDDSPKGGLALPFGPFIALAAIEFFFFGEFLPNWLSLDYLYYGF